MYNVQCVRMCLCLGFSPGGGVGVLLRRYSQDGRLPDISGGSSSSLTVELTTPTVASSVSLSPLLSASEEELIVELTVR